LDVQRSTVFFGYVVLGLVLFATHICLWHKARDVLSRRVEEARLADLETDMSYRAAETQGVCGLPFATQTRSLEFFLSTVWLCVHLFRSNSFIALAHPLFVRNGDDGSASTIFGFILPLGFLAAPVVGRLLEHFGVVVNLQVVNGLGVLVSLVSLVPSVNVQLLNAGLYTFYRATLYSTMAAFNAATFGPATMGRVCGVTGFVAGLVNYTMAPILQFVNDHLHGDPSCVQVGLIACIAPVALLSEAHRRRVRTLTIADS